MKSICIPATPPVDVEPFLPLIDHPNFQRLRERKQLGINYLVFPGAVHTRFEHAIGVLALTQRLCRIHSLSPHDQRLLQAFALLHDIGHGPFSHQIEPVLDQDHHQIGLLRLREMTDEIKACKLNPDELENMFSPQNPLAPWVADRNLGTDKLDYLMRDALHIGFHGTPDIERIQFNTHMTPQGLAIDEKHLEDIKQLQKFYSYLHQHGYLNKTALIAQRVLQRAIVEELIATNASGQDIWTMTDPQLMAMLDNLNAPLARKLIRQLHPAQLPKTVLAIKPQGYAYVENGDQKHMAIAEWHPEQLIAFSQAVHSQKTLRQIENQLADQLNLQHADILIAPMPFFKKLLPKDVQIISHSRKQAFWLLQKDFDHDQSLKSDYLRTFALRITAPPEIRADVAEKTDIIQQYLMNMTQH